MFRRTFSAIAAVGGLLLGLQAIGVTPIAPGTDTGFRESEACARADGFCFETDVGDISALLRLDVDGASVLPADGWRARLGDGTILGIDAQSRDARVLSLVIQQRDTRYGKFTWPGGVPLAVWNESGTSGQVTRWRLQPGDGSHDSRARARWRRIWFWCLLVLLVISVGAVLTQHLSRDTKPSTPREVVEQFVAGIILMVEGRDRAETRMLRKLLAAVLIDRVSVARALEPLARGRPQFQSRALLFKARSEFVKSWDSASSLAAEYRTRLDL